MQETDNNSSSNNGDDEIDLKELLLILFQGKKIIAFVMSFLIILGVIYSLILPNIYESEALLASSDVSSNEGAAGNAGALAELVGINLPSSNTSINSAKALEAMNSLNFFENNLMPKIFLPNLMAIDSWDSEKNTIFYDESLFDVNSNTWVRNFSYPYKLIPSAQESFEIFKEDHLNISEDKKTGFVTLTVKHQSPFLAKQWVELIVSEINSFYRQKDKLAAEKSIKFLSDQITKAGLIEVRQVIAALLQKEIQELTLIEANEAYVFDYIYPPAVMEEKTEPSRAFIIILFTLSGGILGVFIVLIRHLFLRKD
tara:strand:+ start:1531 stop:2469 length:939 start_codon:yes stop_codon:yes gene_type:complete